MLSFQDYLWESQMAQVRQKIALGLIMSGKTLPEVMEEILNRPQVQNEMFGGFVRRLGSAWRAFWHGGESEEKAFSAAEVEEYLAELEATHQKQLADLEASMKKKGMGGSEIQSVLFEIMKQTGGHYYDMMKKVREKQNAAGKYKDGGVMQKTLAVLEKLQSITQDPRPELKEKAEQAEQIEKELADLRKTAEDQLRTATDPADKQEAQSAIEHIDDPNLIQILKGLERLKTELQSKVKGSGSTGATGSSGGSDIDAALKARGGGGTTNLPADPRQALEALRSFAGPKDEALQKWWDAMSDADKVNMHAKLGIAFPIQNVKGNNLRSELQKAANNGKI